MHVVEIFLPTNASLDAELSKLTLLLTEQFGGFTAFTRAPAQGAWRPSQDGRVEHDELIVVEVMTEHLDIAWWDRLRQQLETALHQNEIVIRAYAAERL